MNHAITLGSFSGGRVWVEDKNGSFPAEVKLRTKTHEEHMWALAAYVPQAFRWISNENAERLLSLNFPLPERKHESDSKTLADPE